MTVLMIEGARVEYKPSINRPDTKLLGKQYRSGFHRESRFFSERERNLLVKTYSITPPQELGLMFPRRYLKSIHDEAKRLKLKAYKDVDLTVQAPSRKGLGDLADIPINALKKSRPEIAAAYDNLVESLLSAQGVNRDDPLQVGLIKEAAIMKVTQYLLMADRIKCGMKGTQIVINPKTGFEQVVEAKYLHSADISNDLKLSRMILKDLGIMKEQTQKVEVSSTLRMLWETDPDCGPQRRQVVDVQAETVY